MALMPVADALEQILAGAIPLPAAQVSLRDALGRVTANSVTAKRDQPPFPASAMDGYAVRFADLALLPTELEVAGTSAAGRGYRKPLKPGQAVRIFTGATVPAGADTVVIQENTEKAGDRVRVVTATPKGKNIRPKGLDFRAGTALVEAGTLLNARDVGLIAAANVPRVTVRRRPRIVLLTTGDELVLPGQKPRADQIVSSNSIALEAMYTSWGAEVINLGIIPDKLPRIIKAIRKGLGADILVTTGGASVGDHDFVQEALKSAGVHIGFWKIALRPGKPLMFGTYKKTRVLGLPGNPVSALVCSRIFIKPLINRLQGITATEPKQFAVLSMDMPENDNRRDYVRAQLEQQTDGTRRVTPFSQQDSSMQRTLRLSHCLIIREPHAPPAPAGSAVEILPLDF